MEDMLSRFEGHIGPKFAFRLTHSAAEKCGKLDKNVKVIIVVNVIPGHSIIVRTLTTWSEFGGLNYVVVESWQW